MEERTSLQDRYAPDDRCFGCGPANEKGLRIKSYVAEGGGVVCDWTPSPHHLAFEGMVNGGICGALLDCHSNWAAAYHFLQRSGGDVLPTTVTADFHVKFKRPTPMGRRLHLTARVVDSTEGRAVVEAAIEADGQITATCRGTFVAVREGHPAYRQR